MGEDALSYVLSASAGVRDGLVRVEARVRVTAPPGQALRRVRIAALGVLQQGAAEAVWLERFLGEEPRGELVSFVRQYFVVASARLLLSGCEAGVPVAVVCLLDVGEGRAVRLWSRPTPLRPRALDDGLRHLRRHSGEYPLLPSG